MSITAGEGSNMVRQYVVTMTNPLASGYDGSWGLDLLLECHVCDRIVPSSPIANGVTGSSLAPPEDFGSVSTGGGGGGAVGENASGGGASASRPSESPPPVTGNISDGDSNVSEDPGQEDRGGDGGRTGIEGGWGEDETRRREESGRGELRDGARSRVNVDPLVSDGDDVERMDNSDQGIRANEGTPLPKEDPIRMREAAVQEVAAEAGIYDELGMVSDDECSSDDEPVAEARGVHQTPTGPPSETLSPVATVPTQMVSFRSPDSFASLTAESADLDEGDSSFSDSRNDSGASSEDDVEDDDGYEIDVPYPPCSIMHKSRKTFKQSLCEECYTKYRRDLEKAWKSKSGVDTDAGRKKRKTSPKLRSRLRGKGVLAGDEDAAESRSIRPRTATGETRSPNGDRKKRRKIGKVSIPVVRSQQVASPRIGPKWLKAGGSRKAKKPARARRRLSKGEEGSNLVSEKASRDAEMPIEGSKTIGGNSNNKLGRNGSKKERGNCGAWRQPPEKAKKGVSEFLNPLASGDKRRGDPAGHKIDDVNGSAVRAKVEANASRAPYTTQKQPSGGEALVVASPRDTPKRSTSDLLDRAVANATRAPHASQKISRAEVSGAVLPPKASRRTAGNHLLSGSTANAMRAPLAGQDHCRGEACGAAPTRETSKGGARNDVISGSEASLTRSSQASRKHKKTETSCAARPREVSRGAADKNMLGPPTEKSRIRTTVTPKAISAKHTYFKRALSLDSGAVRARGTQAASGDFVRLRRETPVEPSLVRGATAATALKSAVLAVARLRPLGAASLPPPSSSPATSSANPKYGAGAAASGSRPANDPPLPTKSAYEKTLFPGVVRKRSNSKFFLWVHDKLHDGKPYDGADSCAREYARLSKASRGHNSGLGKVVGDGGSKAPSRAETPDLSALLLNTSGVLHTAKKVPSADQKPPPSSKPKKTQFSLFGPKPSAEARALAFRTKSGQATATTLSRSQPANIDGRMVRRSVSALPYFPSYSEGSSIRWSSKERQGPPKSGLHIPCDCNARPKRSGSKGGRQGRPAPDTRAMCAQRGNSARYHDAATPLEPIADARVDGASSRRSGESDVAEVNSSTTAPPGGGSLLEIETPRAAFTAAESVPSTRTAVPLKSAAEPASSTVLAPNSSPALVASSVVQAGALNIMILSEASKTLGTGKTTNTLGTREALNILETKKASKTLGTKKSSNSVGSREASSTVGLKEASTTMGTTELSNTLGSTELSTTVGTTELSTTVGTTELSNNVGTSESSNTVGTMGLSNTVGSTESSKTVGATELSNTVRSTESSIAVETTESLNTFGSTEASKIVETREASNTVESTESSNALRSTEASITAGLRKSSNIIMRKASGNVETGPKLRSAPKPAALPTCADSDGIARDAVKQKEKSDVGGCRGDLLDGSAGGKQHTAAAATTNKRQDIRDKPRDGEPTAPIVSLRDHLVQIRNNAVNPGGNMQLPWEEEEHGRELLQSMMMAGRTEDNHGDGMVLDSVEKDKHGSRSQGSDFATLRANKKLSPDLDGISGCDNILRAPVASQAVETKKAEGGKKNEDSGGDTDYAHQVVVADIAELTENFMQGVARAMSDGAPACGGIIRGSPRSRCGGQANVVAEDVHTPMSHPPHSRQVSWLKQDRIAHQIDSRTLRKPTVPLRTPWTPPLRLGGSSASSMPAPKESTTDGHLTSTRIAIAERSVNSPSSAPANQATQETPRPSTTSNETTSACNTHQGSWRPHLRLGPSAGPSHSTSVRQFSHQGSDQSGAEVPADVLRLPSRVAKALSEETMGSLTSVAATEILSNRPQIPWRRPARLALSPFQTHPIVTPSISLSSAEHPPENRDQEEEEEYLIQDDAFRFDAPEKSTGETDEGTVDQFQLLLQRSRREYPAQEENDQPAAAASAADNGRNSASSQANGNVGAEKNSAVRREEDMKYTFQRDILPDGQPQCDKEVGGSSSGNEQAGVKRDDTVRRIEDSKEGVQIDARADDHPQSHRVVGENSSGNKHAGVKGDDTVRHKEDSKEAVQKDVRADYNSKSEKASVGNSSENEQAEAEGDGAVRRNKDRKELVSGDTRADNHPKSDKAVGGNSSGNEHAGAEGDDAVRCKEDVNEAVQRDGRADYHPKSDKAVHENSSGNEHAGPNDDRAVRRNEERNEAVQRDTRADDHLKSDKAVDGKSSGSYKDEVRMDARSDDHPKSDKVVGGNRLGNEHPGAKEDNAMRRKGDNKEAVKTDARIDRHPKSDKSVGSKGSATRARACRGDSSDTFPRGNRESRDSPSPPRVRNKSKSRSREGSSGRFALRREREDVGRVRSREKGRNRRRHGDRCDSRSCDSPDGRRFRRGEREDGRDGFGRDLRDSSERERDRRRRDKRRPEDYDRRSPYRENKRDWSGRRRRGRSRSPQRDYWRW